MIQVCAALCDHSSSSSNTILQVKVA